MSKAMDYLIDEHKIILKVVNKMEDACFKLQNGSDLDKDFFEMSIDFIRNYADKFHHAKEENILFIELEKPDIVMHCNPVEQMLIEHDEGRAFILGIENGLRESDKQKVIFNAIGYIDLIRNHIGKEDNALYRMADDALSEEILNKMYTEFKEVDSEKDITKYLNFAK